MSIPINRSSRREWLQAIGAGAAALGLTGLRFAGNVEMACKRRKEFAFSQPMQIKSAWGKAALTHVLTGDTLSPKDLTKDGMDYLMMKYGPRHINTIDVRNAEIAGRIIESKEGAEIKKHFSTINDGILVLCLKNIIRQDNERKYYEIQGTSLSEGYAEKRIEDLSGMGVDKLCQTMNIELTKSYKSPFGIITLRSSN